MGLKDLAERLVCQGLRDLPGLLAQPGPWVAQAPRVQPAPVVLRVRPVL